MSPACRSETSWRTYRTDEPHGSLPSFGIRRRFTELCLVSQDLISTSSTPCLKVNLIFDAQMCADQGCWVVMNGIFESFPKTTKNIEFSGSPNCSNLNQYDRFLQSTFNIFLAPSFKKYTPLRLPKLQQAKSIYSSLTVYYCQASETSAS